MNSRRLQIFELILVLSIGFLPSFVVSFFAFISGDFVRNTFQNTIPAYLSWIIHGLLSIVLMFYVLYRNGKTFRSIGLRYPLKWSDLIHGIGLIIAAILARMVIWEIISLLSPNFLLMAANPRNLDFLNTNVIMLVILCVVFPLQEELIVRGYTMSGVFNITNKKSVAVAISVIIQFSYHLYQGFPSAFMSLPIFIIFALYFTKFKNLNSILIAHVLIDLMSLLYR